MDQWYRVLWSDETWVTPGRHYKTWVTRLPGEDMEDSCLIDRVRRKKGWMFWGSIHGCTKGPGIFWEKDWGKIGQESYCAHTVPIVHGYLRLNPYLVFMQDNTPGHAAVDTQAELAERGIFPIFWPVFSLDLNPIEQVWIMMKDYIEINYPEEDCSYEELRRQVYEAWHSITEEQLRELIQTMPQRCRDVIAAEGGPTKW